MLESEAVEALALSGGFLALVALIELAISIFILGAGAGGALQSASCWLASRRSHDRLALLPRNRTWTDLRLHMTHDLVESMVGHRTRLAQLPSDRWHEGEDEALERISKSSKVLDDSTAALLAIVPRGWLVLALLGLAPAFVAATASTATHRDRCWRNAARLSSSEALSAGAWQLVGAAVAWERVSVLFHAAARKEVTGSLNGHRAQLQPSIDAHNLAFRYSDETPQSCATALSTSPRRSRGAGRRVGRRKIHACLAAGRTSRTERRSSLLIDGLNRQTLGADAWRRHIAAAPQFHENHVLAETFAFNLIMGRHKPPSPRDFPEAEAIARELGLGELLERMPAGLLQMVGETGWQLSHGERSRLYIARALLQDADLVVLDESFAALDPENLQRAVECSNTRWLAS